MPWGPSPSLPGAFSGPSRGLLGPSRGLLGDSGTFWDLLQPSPTFLGSSQGFSCLLRAISGRRVPLRALWNFSKLSLTALVLVPSHPWRQQPYQPHAGVLGLRYSTAEHWLILDSLIVDSKKWLRRRLVVIFGQFFFIKTVWCHLSQVTVHYLMKTSLSLKLGLSVCRKTLLEACCTAAVQCLVRRFAAPAHQTNS